MARRKHDAALQYINHDKSAAVLNFVAAAIVTFRLLMRKLLERNADAGEQLEKLASRPRWKTESPSKHEEKVENARRVEGAKKPRGFKLGNTTCTALFTEDGIRYRSGNGRYLPFFSVRTWDRGVLV